MGQIFFVPWRTHLKGAFCIAFVVQNVSIAQTGKNVISEEHAYKNKNKQPK